jgi:hypothetical protein
MVKHKTYFRKGREEKGVACADFGQFLSIFYTNLTD